MNALSRREEDTLTKTAKTRALKECDAFVKGCARRLTSSEDTVR
jgi:COX assembly mitochondrial protein 1